MMRPIDLISGRAYPLGRDNIDTDIILPGRFLKTITRDGLGAAAFESLRAAPGNIFADPAYAGAPILVAGENFGCGSSREHAVWAMLDMGIVAVIASSFSDIFAGNAFKNGMLAVALAPEDLALVLGQATGGELTIDLSRQEVRIADGRSIGFEIDAFRKDCLLRGLDEVELSLAFADDILRFEEERARRLPWIA